MVVRAGIDQEETESSDLKKKKKQRQMFRYSRNNRIVQDALGHDSFSDSTGIIYFQEEVHL